MKQSNRSTAVAALLAFAVLCAPLRAADATARQTYALVVAGEGIEPVYTETYRDWSVRLHKLLTAGFGIPSANVRLLMESQELVPTLVSAVSTKENILKAFDELNAKVNSGDQFIVLFMGHGTAQKNSAKLCIPGPNLTNDETAALLNKIKAGETVFINTAACSYNFLESCSAPGRVVITSTNGNGEGHETYFMEFLLQAYEKGSRSQTLLAAFNTAAAECPKWYMRQYFDKPSHSWRTEGKQSRELWKKFYGKIPDKVMANPQNPDTDDVEPVLGEWGEQWAFRRIPTEHAQLDDNGDKLGTAVYANNQFTPLTGEKDADGALAAGIVLGKPSIKK